jgi:hypothetical protein
LCRGCVLKKRQCFRRYRPCGSISRSYPRRTVSDCFVRDDSELGFAVYSICKRSGIDTCRLR